MEEKERQQTEVWKEHLSNLETQIYNFFCFLSRLNLLMALGGFLLRETEEVLCVLSGVQSMDIGKHLITTHDLYKYSLMLQKSNENNPPRAWCKRFYSQSIFANCCHFGQFTCQLWWGQLSKSRRRHRPIGRRSPVYTRFPKKIKSRQVLTKPSLQTCPEPKGQ